MIGDYFFLKAGGASSVAFSIQAYLASEHAIDEDEIADREDHPEAPPVKTYGQPVGTGRSICDSETVLSFAGGRTVG